MHFRSRIALAGLSACTLAVATPGNAQSEVVRAPKRESPIQRGSIQISGTASFVLSRDLGNDYGWSTLEILPRVGYFVAKGLAVTANLRYRGVWYDDQAAIRDQTFREWGIGPGVTYFVSTRSPRVFPFVAGRTLYSRGRTRFDRFATPQSTEPVEEDVTSRTTTATWQVSAGALYMLVKHVGITGEGFYQRTKATSQSPGSNESTNSAQQYGAQWGIAAFVF